MSTATEKRSELIEAKIDKGVTGELSIGGVGAKFSSMTEVMEFAKIMAVGGVSVPAFLRGNPGACLAVTLQAIEWRMSPFAVANKAYSVNDRISYESQLVHAVVEQRAPLTKRLRHRFDGEGENRTCTVIGYVDGEDEPLTYTSPPIGKITPKNSPLWKTKPDLQLYYNASRDWARMYFPDVIMGVYTNDELDDAKPERKAAPRTLGELARSRVESATVVTKEQQPEDEPTPDLSMLQRYEIAVKHAATEADARDLYEAACNPDNGYLTNEDDVRAAGEMLNAKLAALKGA